jgi:hypothetical protein
MFLYRVAGAVTLDNSTVSGNTAGRGGGIYLYRPNGSQLTINSSTLMGNTATAAGGNIEGGTLASTINITNSIIAGGTAPVGADIDQGPTTINMNFSLLQAAAGVVVAGGNNITGVSPQLGPLANNGGPTQTHLPAAASPVINAGTLPVAATDQRLLPRVVGAAPDMGSVEAAAAALPVSGIPVPTLSQWMLALLASLMAMLGLRRQRAPRRT